MYPIKFYLNNDYQAMEVLGVKGVFSNLRVENESLPEGFYKYSLREAGKEYFSSVERSVLVNHSGDFICKEELPLGDDGYKDLVGDYSFTGEPVDLDEFFGMDIKNKVAEALDKFMFEYDPYSYRDNLENGQEDMVDAIRTMLEHKEQVKGIIDELNEICDEEKSSLDNASQSFLSSLINKLDNIVYSFPEKRVELVKQINVAEAQKEKLQSDGSMLEPERSKEE